MNFRNISSWCIRNPVFPIVLFIGLMLAGVVAFMGMQVNNAPDIDFPAALVSVSQPGAAPNELETQVTQRVESAIRGVNGVDEMSSTVTEGNSTTFVQFQLGTPTDRAVNDVRNAIAQIRGTLPDGILEPQITRVDAEDEPISYIGAQTTDMTLEQLSWYIDNNVTKRLLGCRASRGPTGRRSRPDDPGHPRSRRAAGAGHHRRAGQSAAPAKQYERRRRPSRDRRFGAVGPGARQRPRRLSLSQMQIALPGGRFAKLADLGEVKDSNSEQRSMAKMNGRQVVTFYSSGPRARPRSPPTTMPGRN